MPAELVDRLSAHAAESASTRKGPFSIGCRRDAECRLHSVLTLAELPSPAIRLTASRRQGARKTIRAQRMGAPIRVNRETRRRRNERSGKRPAEHVGRENVGQGLPQTRERAAIHFRPLLLPFGHEAPNRASIAFKRKRLLTKWVCVHGAICTQTAALIHLALDRAHFPRFH